MNSNAHDTHPPRPPAPGNSPATWIAAAVLFAGIGLSGWVARSSWRSAMENDHIRFSAAVAGTRQRVEDRVEYYEQALVSFREWLQWHQTPSIKDWDTRLDRLDLKVNFSGLREVGYLPLINPQNIALWSNSIPRHWTNIWPRFPALDGSTLAYCTSVDGGGTGSIGRQRLDLTSTAAFQDARKTASLKTSGRIDFNAGARGFRAFVAVYQDSRLKGVTPWVPGVRETDRHLAMVQDRMQAVAGVIYADVALDRIIESAFGTGPQEVDFVVYAGPVSESNRVSSLRPGHAGTAQWSTNYVIPWYGQKWTLACTTTPLFWEGSQRARWPWIAAAGSTVSLALASIIWVQTRARSRAELLSRELQDSRELLKQAGEERARMSRDLHDGTVQSIYAIGLGLQQARRSLPAASPAASQLDKALHDMELVVTQLRRYLQSGSERPQKLSLNQALKDLVDRWGATCDTRFDLRLQVPEALDVAPAMIVELLDMTQECISNSVRHGHAGSIQISLDATPESWELRVTDDGVGFDPSLPYPGSGLRNLHERARDVGGRCRIESHPHVRTCVTAILPRQRKAATAQADREPSVPGITPHPTQ